ncbi:hypothetical protein T265_01350 [Opisthorchis viverrini]|uniref:Uncharacterized protein n=1 Tax=Opisthorchis viverrini TaxID=6198 RepID=A0A075A035_OPIVI|nr:hypothetical protein T265_01350 [Opisthorchis viverrini]KER32666.1 hypothetical protein T265_01350 [Opisthorchis viverrini]
MLLIQHEFISPLALQKHNVAIHVRTWQTIEFCMSTEIRTLSKHKSDFGIRFSSPDETDLWEGPVKQVTEVVWDENIASSQKPFFKIPKFVSAEIEEGILHKPDQ